MNEEVRQQLDKLQKQIDELRQATDVINVESLRKRVFQEIISAGVISTATTSDVNESVPTVPATVAKDYNKKVRVEIDGVPYYLGLYNV